LGDVMQKVMNVAELGAEEYAYLFDLIPCHISFVDRNLRIIKTNALSRIDFGDCVGEYCYKAFKKRRISVPVAVCRRPLPTDAGTDARMWSSTAMDNPPR
jgi:hypothetical protein